MGSFFDKIKKLPNFSTNFNIGGNPFAKNPSDPKIIAKRNSKKLGRLDKTRTFYIITFVDSYYDIDNLRDQFSNESEKLFEKCNIIFTNRDHILYNSTSEYTYDTGYGIFIDSIYYDMTKDSVYISNIIQNNPIYELYFYLYNYNTSLLNAIEEYKNQRITKEVISMSFNDSIKKNNVLKKIVDKFKGEDYIEILTDVTRLNALPNIKVNEILHNTNKIDYIKITLEIKVQCCVLDKIGGIKNNTYTKIHTDKAVSKAKKSTYKLLKNNFILINSFKHTNVRDIYLEGELITHLNKKLTRQDTKYFINKGDLEEDPESYSIDEDPKSCSIDEDCEDG